MGLAVIDRYLLRASRTCAVHKRGVRGLALVLAALALTAFAACGGGDPEPPPPQEPLTAEEQALAEHLRHKTAELWLVYNGHDVDGLRVFYEESYFESEEAELRRNMEFFESGKLVITAEETSPPTEIEPGRWQIKQKASWDGGSVNMNFIYEQIDGEWLLTYAETD